MAPDGLGSASRPAKRARLRRRLALLLLLAILDPSGCNSLARKRKEATYAPTESILEVVAVLRRHVPDDTYRFPPGTDFSGRNVYRASLLRLENLEKLHSGALRAGQLDEVIRFAKGRALERLRAYDLAAQHFAAARSNEVLREAADRSARLNAAIAEATRIGIELENPLEPESLLPLDSHQVIADLDLRVARLSDLLARELPVPYAAILREEIERTDVIRASYFTAMRQVLQDGNLRAVAEWQRTITNHAASKFRQRHMIAAADLFAVMAREYVIARPPESLTFDPPMFRELVDGATHLYQAVAQKDGTPEKLEASRRLEAFLAFTLQVDHERFAR
jgi:hypothetical protein